MISIEIEEWQQIKAKMSKLEQEVLLLRNQNRYLRNQLHGESNPQKILSSEVIDVKYESCQKVHSDQSQTSKDKESKKSFRVQQREQLFLEPEEGQNYSVHIGEKQHATSSQNIAHQPNFIELNRNVDVEDDSDEQRSIIFSRKKCTQSQLKSIITSKRGSLKQRTQNLPLVQEICVFGPSLEKINEVTFKHDSKQFLEPMIYFPKQNQQYQKYANYIYPRKIRVKPTQALNIPIETNKIIFKNSKKQECRVFIFKGSESHPINEPNQVLDKCNPSKWLYAIVMDFNDFIFQDAQTQQSTRQSTFKQHLQVGSPTLKTKKIGSLLNIDTQMIQNEQMKLQNISLKDIQFEKQKSRMYRTNFSICLFTYFPFITFLQNLIYKIFDEVKLKRIEHFSYSREVKSCDILYFIQTLKDLAEEVQKSLKRQPIQMQQTIQLKINQGLLYLQLKEEKLYEQLYGKWPLRLFKMIDKDTLYQIYLFILMEQSVYFVCEDQKLLTLVILLFSSMLTQPFSYPYPVISILFNQQLLQTPFVSIIGINESQAWVQKAEQRGLIDGETKNIVFIKQKQIKLRSTSKCSLPKSQNLYKLFSKFYKKYEPSSLTSILLKGQFFFSSQNPKETNENVINFFINLQLYFHENIFSYLPSKMIISKMDGQLQTGNEEQMSKPNLRKHLLQHIQKCYISSNPKYLKDEFIKRFLKTQIFSICLMEQYQIK